METLELLAAALGLAALAGINLYLTVFIISLSLNVGWLNLSPEFAHLAVLANPGILVLSGALTVIEFFADKIIWLDSFWDSIHTAIRPIGAAFLAIAVLGDMSPALEIVSALLCGGVALTTHTTKAGLRLMVNTSPEPFSNVLTSLFENVLVVLGTLLVYFSPLAAAIVAAIFILTFLLIAPKLLRAVWTSVRLIFHALLPFELDSSRYRRLPDTLPIPERRQLTKDLKENEPITWTVPVLTGRNPGLRRNQPAQLIYLQESNRMGLIVRNKPIRWISTEKLETHDHYRPLFNEISFFDRTSEESIVVRLFKNQTTVLERILAAIRGSEEETPSEPSFPKPRLGSLR